MKYVLKFIFLVAVLAFGAVVSFAQNTGGIKGKVRAANGDGISAAIIVIRQNGEEIRTVTADSKGDFAAENLKVGTYDLIISKSGYSSGVLSNVEIKKNKTRDLGGKLFLSVDRGTQIIIKGVVFDRDGKSIAGVKVDIEKISGDGSAKKVNSTYTSSGSDPGVRGGDGNARGEFTFRFAEEAAKYRVTASLKDSTASKEIEVSSAAIYRLAITLNEK